MARCKQNPNSKKVISNDELKKIVDETNGDITLQEIGDLYGITRMRVCQIEKLSLKKLAETALLQALTKD